MRKLALALPALLALLVASTAAAPTGEAPTATAPSACPSLLTLLNAMPDSSLFADILESLGSRPQPVVAEPPLPPPGSGNGSAQLTLSRRRLAEEQPAADAAKPGQPVACPAIFDPVCGTNNATYGNACAASAAGAVVACKGECPCKGGGGGTGVCIDMFDPVCGADGRNYTNACFAQVAGARISCLGGCPCPDLVRELEVGGGGLLLVPTDEALLAELDALNATGTWDDSTAALQQLLARHAILTDHQKALGGNQPVPTPQGTAAVTEAGQRVLLFSGSGQVPGRVQTLGAEVLDSYTILSTAQGCSVALAQINGVLQGLPAQPTA